MVGPASEDGLRALLRANQELTSALELHEVLRRLVQTALTLVPARYGALGVLAEGGHGLSDFIHVGIDDEQAARIGSLPQGRGLLGLLITEPHPLRVDHMAAHPASSGFPPHHPPMESFLGVPIRVRGEIFGNLYLAEHVDGSFSSEDEEMILALAASAGVAIANARLFEETRYRAQWSAALSAAVREVDEHDDDPVEDLLAVAAGLAGCELARVLVSGDDGALTLRHVRGVGGVVVEDLAAGAEALTLEALRTAQPVSRTVAGADGRPQGVVAAPFTGAQGVRGALHLVRVSAPVPFLARDLEMAGSFAAHVGALLGQARLRAVQERYTLLADRDRIARDLHDHVIQRLYAAGLRLSAIASQVQDEVVADRVRGQIDELDTTIVQIRQAIHALSSPDQASPRSRLSRLVEEVAGFAVTPELIVRGPVDTVLGTELLLDVLAVVREALTNALRHGHARSAGVEVTAAADAVEVRVSDDGSGLGQITRAGGLSNLRHRARVRGGTLEVHNAEGGGATLLWRVPLGAGAGATREGGAAGG